MSLHLLKRERADRPIVLGTPGPSDDDALHGIRCPRCAWRPSPSSRWSCAGSDGPEPPFDACGLVWNTFATRGRCPRCRHQWRWTSCLRCGQWSPHDDWYERTRPRFM